MKNRILALAIVIFCIVPTLKAADISLGDSKELLNLVATEKDFTDALDLLVLADNVDDLKDDAEISERIEALAKKYDSDLGSWNAVEDDGDSSDSGTTKPEGVPKEKDASLWAVFFLAFGAGFIALIMPCVFPMIPMTVSFFTKRSPTKAKGIKNALIYGASIVLIHVLLGAIVVLTGAGELLNQLSTNVYFNIFFFLMLFAFGLSFLGAFEIQLPASWVNKADSKADKGGIVGIFFMALVLSLASFSCSLCNH